MWAGVSVQVMGFGVSYLSSLVLLGCCQFWVEKGGGCVVVAAAFCNSVMQTSCSLGCQEFECVCFCHGASVCAAVFGVGYYRSGVLCFCRVVVDFLLRMCAGLVW